MPSFLGTTQFEHSPGSREFVMTRDFAAPRSLVYRAWTEPGQLATWWGPRAISTPICQLDVRPGGSYRIVMRGPDGEDYPITGVFREVIAPERLVLTMDVSEHSEAWHDAVKPDRRPGEKPVGDVLLTVLFAELDPQTTRLTIRQQFRSEEIRDALVKLGMKAGWGESLEKLAELIAQR